MNIALNRCYILLYINYTAECRYYYIVVIIIRYCYENLVGLSSFQALVIYYITLHIVLCFISHFDIIPELLYKRAGHNALVYSTTGDTNRWSHQHHCNTRCIRVHWDITAVYIIIIKWQYIIQSHSRDNFLIASRLSAGSNLISAAMSLNKTRSVYIIMNYIISYNIIIYYDRFCSSRWRFAAVPPLNRTALMLYVSYVCIIRFGRIFFRHSIHSIVKQTLIDCWNDCVVFIKININPRTYEGFCVWCSTHKFKQTDRTIISQLICFSYHDTSKTIAKS